MGNVYLIINISLASVIIARFTDHKYFPFIYTILLTIQTRTYSHFNQHQLKQPWKTKGRNIAEKMYNSP